MGFFDSAALFSRFGVFDPCTGRTDSQAKRAERHELREVGERVSKQEDHRDQ